MSIVEMDKELIVRDLEQESLPLPLSKCIILSLLLLLSGCAQVVVLPLLLASFPIESSPSHFVLFFSAFGSLLIFFVCTLVGVIVQGTKPFLQLYFHWKHLSTSGLFLGLGSVIIVYASHPTNTPPQLQALYTGVTTLFSLFTLKLITAEPTLQCYHPIPVFAVLLILCGYGLSFYESIVMIGNGSFWTGPFWQILYVMGILLMAFGYAIEWQLLSGRIRREKFAMEETSKPIFGNIFSLLSWTHLFKLLTYLSLFWADVIPQFGYTDNFDALTSNFNDALICFFGGCDNNVWIYGIIYVISIFIYESSHIVLISPYMAIFRGISQAIIPPISISFWFIFSSLIPTESKNELTLWVILTSMFLMLLGQVTLRIWERREYYRLDKGEDEVLIYSDEEEVKNHPLAKASFFSILTYHWVGSLLRVGYKRPLESSDVWKLLPIDGAEYNTNILEEAWRQEQKRDQPSIKRAFIRAFGLFYVPAFISTSIWIICHILGPGVVLRYLLNYFQDNGPAEEGWLLVFGVSMLSLVTVFAAQFSWYSSVRASMRIKQAFVQLAYQKILKLQQVNSSGQLLNLCSTDSNRVLLLCRQVGAMPYCLFVIIGVSIILIVQMGWSAVIGIVVLISLITLNSYIGKKISKIRNDAVKITDERVKVMNDVLSAIKLVKLYCWEESFGEKIREVRKREVKFLQVSKMYKAINMFIGTSASTVAAFALLVSHSLMGYEIVASEAFSAIALLFIVQMPFIILPNMIKYAAESLIAFNRLQQTLLLEELHDTRQVDLTSKVISVKIENADLRVSNLKPDQEPQNIKKTEKSPLLFETVPDDLDEFLMKNITLEGHPGMLIGIVGSVGSGKSTLLKAILGEAEIISGTIKVNGSTAYASQQAWLVNATLKENIIFGLPYDEDKYNFVLNKCELLEDLKLLPAGDETEIGERGINLSGGQKQRVSLARALYTNKDIYLLDDPLSAVDQHVGNSLFKNCIREALRNKVVFFVTNQLQYLDRCDQIIMLKDGQVIGQGSYELMMRTNSVFEQLLSKFSSTNEEVKEEGEIIKNKPDKHKLKNKAQEGPSGKGQLMSVEDRRTGSVGIKTYIEYGKAGGPFLTLVTIFMVILAGVSQVMANWFISFWIDDKANQENSFYISIYSGLLVGLLLIYMFRGLLFMYATLNSATNIHNKMFMRTIRAPMSFFDSTPMGRILNRFSQDQDRADETLPDTLFEFIILTVSSICTVGLIVGVLPWFGLVVLPLLGIFYYVTSYFLRSSQELKRLEAISASPVFAHILTTIQGLTTIRAYNSLERFREDSIKKLRFSYSCMFAAEMCARWVGFRLDLVGVTILSGTAIFFMILKDQFTPSIAGLALSYSYQMIGAFQFGVRMFGETESQMTSVERLLYFCHKLPQEREAKISHNSPPPEWPVHGTIQFNNITMRYNPEHDPVLRNLSFKINPKEKIGIVGRTGAGKSTLTLALFRLLEPEGSILIDDVDITQIGLDDLRSKLAIIPQDPVLFLGSIRTNLDPWGAYRDDEIWTVLQQVHMKKTIEELNQGLESIIEESGSNFSLGQRQLLCIGRALLRKSKILVLDEATAAIDIETDSLIQRTIRENFAECTVLTIAHRLHTIIDNDRIMVMDQGQIIEFDTPHNLLNRPNSMFLALVNETDKKTAANLRAIADGDMSFYDQ